MTEEILSRLQFSLMLIAISIENCDVPVVLNISLTNTEILHSVNKLGQFSSWLISTSKSLWNQKLVSDKSILMKFFYI